MSDTDIDREFRAMVDAFVDLANDQGETAAHENVGMALLYAAARYNAYVVASHAPDLARYEADRGKATEFFGGEYRRMLDENLDDYRRVYDETLKYAHLMTRPSGGSD